GRLGGRPSQPAAQTLRRGAHFPPAKLDALRAAARRAKVPWSVLLIAAAALYTQRLSGAEDVVLGLPVTARTDATLKRTPGMVSNAVPLRLSPRLDLPWPAFVAEVAQAIREALAHQRYRGEDIHRDLGLSGSARSLFAPTVNIMAFDHDLRFAEAPATARNLTVGQASDWSIVVCDRRDGAGLSIDWHAHPEVFEAEELAAHQDRFISLLETFSAIDPAQPVGRIGLLLPAERRQWLVAACGPVQAVPQAHLPALFEARAAQTPDRPALAHGGATLSYAEFNLKANRLAHHLIALGAGPERRVALMLPRSGEGVVALMAVLKSGAAYVPIDPDYPAERIGFMLDDAKPVLLLAHGETLSALAGVDAPPTLRLDDPALQAELARQPGANPSDADRLAPLRLNHPAYVIYTSGSTGRPKGVIVEHRSVSDYLAWTACAYPAAAGLALLHSPLSFDLTVTALWTPLVAGGCVRVAALEDAPAPGLPPHTFLKATPSHLPLLAALAGELDFAPEAEFLFGGEALLGEALAEWRKLRPEAALLNVYGPTEATVNCAEYRIEPGQPIAAGPVPIGRPQANARLYVLDAALQPLPTGVAGELYIAGAGLARGYLARPGLTAKRFVADPFGGLLGEPGARMYRTGDRARWLACGNLEFLGRVDEQVKVRGFRIELGEIEASLARHPSVAQVAVIVREDRPGDKRLVAYVVAERPSCPAEALRRHLEGSLPEYMVPAAFVVLDALPLTPNGKLNRKALPAPDFNPVAPGRAPRSAQERLLCQLFAEVLGLQQVGVDDSFFALGGDSIMAIQLVSRARKAGFTITSREVFEHKTAAGLAAVARAVSGVAADSAEAGVGAVVLTPIMRRLCERGGLLDGYSQGVVVQTPAGFVWDDLARLLQALLDRHDMLRARLLLADGQHTMRVEPVGAVSAARCLLRVDATGWDDETARQAIVAREAAAAIARLAPQAGLMLQAPWLDRGATCPGRLVLVVNHLVVDGVSLRILTEDLAAGARQLAAGRELALEPCATPFRHWARQLAAQALTAARVGEM
ncbi:MAG: non-ribosomal peptide synthetase, partial [Candidatus Methylumidiphilus sp.]